MAVPLLNSVDVLLGIIGLMTFSAIILQNLRILKNFAENEEVSMTMFFLRRESAHSLRALVYGALLFAGTVIASALGALFGVRWLLLGAKISAAVFMMTYLLFYTVIAEITTPGPREGLVIQFLRRFSDD